MFITGIIDLVIAIVIIWKISQAILQRKRMAIFLPIFIFGVITCFRSSMTLLVFYSTNIFAFINISILILLIWIFIVIKKKYV